MTKTEVAKKVRTLASEHHVTYKPGAYDALAGHITVMAGDTVRLDDTELLMVALQRAGVLSRQELILMQANYLRPAVS